MTSNINNQKKMRRALAQFKTKLDQMESYLEANPERLENGELSYQFNKIQKLYFSKEDFYHAVESYNHYIDQQFSTRGRNRHEAIVNRQKLAKMLTRIARSYI